MKKLLLILALAALISNYALADASTYLNFTAVNGPATIALDSVGTPNEINLLYSTDNCSTWNTYTIGNTISLASGAKVYFKALNTNDAFAIGRYVNYWFKVLSCYQYKMTGTIAADGNIMSLLDETMNSTTVPDCAFACLFDSCASLISAPVLPATTLSWYCYHHMFTNCTSLESAPVLPAPTVLEGCYQGMFSGCTSLISVPDLQASTLSKYSCDCMFYGCTALETAPALLATNLGDYCYWQTFSGCTSLKTVPALPAVRLAYDCYREMYGGCTSLTSFPALPAKTLAPGCYQYMFMNCSSLATAPAILADTVASSCCYMMFSDCTSLTYVPDFTATTLASGCYSTMFSNCSSLTTAPALPATTLAPSCYNSMFRDCSSLTTAPALPATTLAEQCYQDMFSGCMLTTLPELPADSLPAKCYQSMFFGCPLLTLNTEAPGKEWSIQASYVGDNSLKYMFEYTAGTMNGTPSANTTYYLPAYVEDVDTSSADAYFYCNTVFDYVPVARFHFTMYRTGGSDTVDIYFANDTSFTINRLPRTVNIIDSVTGNTTTVTITINHISAATDYDEINVHLENLAPNSTYYLTLTPLDASDNVLDSYSSGFVTPEADVSTPTAVVECQVDKRDNFFPSENTDVYTIDGRYVGKYSDSLPAAIYIMWEDGKAHKFAKIR